MTDTFAKKKLEIVVERPILNRMLALLDRLDVSGYTAIPALAGRGRGGAWRREGQVGQTGQMVVVLCILDAERVDVVLDEVYTLLEPQLGIVTVSDVDVIRADHF